MALFLTPLFEPLPEATLGAIVIVAVLGMMKVGKMRRLWELRRIDFWLAMIALVGVLVMPTLEALGLAVVASLGVLVWRASEARLTFLGRASGGLEPVDLRTAPDAAIPGLLIVRPDEMLFFANVASVRDGILAAVAETEPRPTVVLLDLSLTPEVDVPVVEALEDLHERLAADGIELWLATSGPDARDLLERAGVLAAIGDARIHAARRRRDPGVRPPPAGRRRAGRRPDGPAGVHPRARDAAGHERRGRGDPGRPRAAPGGRAGRRGRGARRLTGRATRSRTLRRGGRTRRRSARPGGGSGRSAGAGVPAAAAHDAPHAQVVVELHEVGALARLEAAAVRHARGAPAARARPPRPRAAAATPDRARFRTAVSSAITEPGQVAAVGQHAAVAVDDARPGRRGGPCRADVPPNETPSLTRISRSAGLARRMSGQSDSADVVPVGDQLDVGVVVEERRDREPRARGGRRRSSR